MKKLLLGLAALPFMGSVAMAGHTLTPAQMDGVTAGNTGISIIEAVITGITVTFAPGSFPLSENIPTIPLGLSSPSDHVTR